MPGVCGSFSDTEDSDQKKYSMWFDKYLGHEYKDLLHGEDCFILQQACLFRMVSVEKLIIAEKYRFVLPDKSLVKHKVYMGGVLQLDINAFCQDMCKAFEIWLEDIQQEANKQHYLEQLSQTSAKVLNL